MVPDFLADKELGELIDNSLQRTSSSTLNQALNESGQSDSAVSLVPCIKSPASSIFGPRYARNLLSIDCRMLQICVCSQWEKVSSRGLGPTVLRNHLGSVLRVRNRRRRQLINCHCVIETYLDKEFVKGPCQLFSFILFSSLSPSNLFSRKCFLHSHGYGICCESVWGSPWLHHGLDSLPHCSCRLVHVFDLFPSLSFSKPLSAPLHRHAGLPSFSQRFLELATLTIPFDLCDHLSSMDRSLQCFESPVHPRSGLSCSPYGLDQSHSYVSFWWLWVRRPPSWGDSWDVRNHSSDDWFDGGHPSHYSRSNYRQNKANNNYRQYPVLWNRGRYTWVTGFSEEVDIWYANRVPLSPLAVISASSSS